MKLFKSIKKKGLDRDSPLIKARINRILEVLKEVEESSQKDIKSINLQERIEGKFHLNPFGLVNASITNKASQYLIKAGLMNSYIRYTGKWYSPFSVYCRITDKGLCYRSETIFSF